MASVIVCIAIDCAYACSMYCCCLCFRVRSCSVYVLACVLLLVSAYSRECVTCVFVLLHGVL